MDSALVYRDMDIGTAKPGAATLAAVPHHLVDIVPPTEAYSAGRFRDDALRVAGEIAARGRVPLFAGGTMLYERALMRGLAALPAADPGVRAELDARGEGPRVARAARRAREGRSRERRAPRSQRRAAHPAGARGLAPFRPQPHRAHRGRGPRAARPSPRSRWCSSPRTGRCCTGGSRSASARCSPAGSWRRWWGFAPGTRWTRACRRCGPWATARCGRRSRGSSPRRRWRRGDARPRGNWPSASSRGCGRCGKWSGWTACAPASRREVAGRVERFLER